MSALRRPRHAERGPHGIGGGLRLVNALVPGTRSVSTGRRLTVGPEPHIFALGPIAVQRGRLEVGKLVICTRRELQRVIWNGIDIGRDQGRAEGGLPPVPIEDSGWAKLERRRRAGRR